MKKYIFICLLCCLFMCGCTISESDMKSMGFEKDNGSTVSLTLSQYNNIKEGDSLSNIESAIGTSCNVYYESNDNVEKWCRFWDKDDSNKKIVLKFKNNILVSKSQSGL